MKFLLYLINLVHNFQIQDQSYSQNFQTVQASPTLNNNTQECACAVNFKCPPCGPQGYETEPAQCPCSPSLSCPNCMLGKILQKFHNKSAEQAQKEAKVQNRLAAESLLEKKLFEQAKKYADEATDEERLAKEAAIQLQEHANKAALARQKMLKTENQAKQVVFRAINTLSKDNDDYQKDEGTVQVHQIGTNHISVSQNIPQYQISIRANEEDPYPTNNSYNQEKNQNNQILIDKSTQKLQK